MAPRAKGPGQPHDPLWFLPRGAALLQRVLLSEVLGPPRGHVPWRSPFDEAPDAPPTTSPPQPAGSAPEREG